MSELQRRSRRAELSSGRVGTQTQSHDFTKLALSAQIEMKRLGKKPHPVGHGHWRKVREYRENDADLVESRFVLMEYNGDGNKQLKWKMMTRLEAWKRNETLRGTGFAWALCNSSTKI